MTEYYGDFLEHMPDKVASMYAASRCSESDLRKLWKECGLKSSKSMKHLLDTLRLAQSKSKKPSETSKADAGPSVSYTIEFDTGDVMYHIPAARVHRIDRRCHTLERFMDAKNKREKTVGLDPVKRWLEELTIDTLARYAHGEPLQPINVVLNGGPGSGKRTAARMIAASLCALGLVQHEELDECDYISERVSSKVGIKNGWVNYTGADDFDGRNTPEAQDLWRWLLASGVGDKRTVLLWGVSSAEASGYVQRACPAFASVQFRLPALQARQVAEIALQRFEALELDLETAACQQLSSSDESESESQLLPESPPSPRSRQIALLEKAISAQYPPREIEAKSGYLAGIFVDSVISRKSQRLTHSASDAVSPQWLSAMGRIVQTDLGLNDDQQHDQQHNQLRDEVIREKERADVEAELDQMEGMEKPKALLRSLGRKCRTVETSGASKRVLHVCNNLILMGNPGTGKSTFARLMFRYFRAYGVIRKNAFVEVNGLDLIGKYVGSTGPKVKNIVASALGGMLFIDEAYALLPKKGGGSFNGEAVRMLLTEIENNRESLLVVMAGYEDKMDEFIMSDPGLRSRFPHTLKLPNYSPRQLAAIATSTAHSRFGLKLEPGLEAKLAKDWAARHSFMLSKYNARFAVQQVEIATEKYIERLGEPAAPAANKAGAAKSEHDHVGLLPPIPTSYAEAPKPVLLGRDFELEDEIDVTEERQAKITEAEEELGRLVGASALKQHMKRLTALVNYVNKRGGDPSVLRQCLNLVLVGAPGTGKTTAARLIGKFLRAHGVLQSESCVEMNALELMGEYCGQTAPKVKAAFERASGGVLFLDEAYALSSGSDQRAGSNKFAGEAIRMLLTEIEQSRADTMVILAGYEDKMHQFLAADPGLRSRFPTTIQMKDLSGNELALVAENVARDRFKLVFEPGLRTHLAMAFDNHLFGDTQNGNGRLAVNAVERALRCLAERVVADEMCDAHELKPSDFGIVLRNPAVAA